MAAKLFVYDEFSPEDMAMLQALYSRSASSVEEHVQKVKATGSGKFMEQYYIGYNHKSIGDCGTTTLFIESVSELAAKAIQDWQLYSGQQTSTRYIDFTKQPVVDPLGSELSGQIMAGWMDFYKQSLEPLNSFLIEKYPRGDEDEKQYKKAIKARGFDILRAFLPAGVTTQLSWHTNLRQVWDKLVLLHYHPLQEIADLSVGLKEKLQGKYPNSFNYKEYEQQENYRKFVTGQESYFFPDKKTPFSFTNSINKKELKKYRDVLEQRPFHTELPAFLDELGLLQFDFQLDYGSFRDVQRHRHGVCRMPLLTTELGFEEWYLEQLSPELYDKALQLLKKQEGLIGELETTPEVKQYYTAMGYKIQARVSYGLPASIYVTELRSGKTVHPTLRKVAHKMDAAIRKSFPFVKMWSDLEADEFSAKRGNDDISEK